MRSEPTSLRNALIAALVFGLVAGCATSSPERRPDETAARAPEATTDAARETRPSGTPGNAPEAAIEPPAEPTVIEQILADRRRGDYPEIELQEAGFTITEQVRIGSSARTDYDRAIGLLEAGRHADGIAVLRQVIESTPDATAPYIDLGIALAAIGELEQAEEALATANLLSPENPVVLNELGILYRKTGRFADARMSYEQALTVFSGFHFARRNLAVLCDLYLADTGCAIENYRAYLDAVGGDSEVEIWVADLENRMAN